MSTSEWDLKQRWHELRRREPGVRARDAAESLGVSEAQLVATGLGENVTRLAGDGGDVLRDVSRLGEVVALTRNAHAVIEKTGTYGALEVTGSMGQVVGPEIDLRVFLGRWRHGFAVTEETTTGSRGSLQFFDGAGTAIHKVYLTGASDRAAWEALVMAAHSVDQSPEFAVSSVPPEVSAPPADVDVEALRAEWRAMQDTHDFVWLLRRFGLRRLDGVRLGAPEFSRSVSTTSLRTALGQAAETALPIMVFVGNAGIIQIHSGPVHHVEAHGPWMNVLDPRFNLHVRADRIAETWVVEKPTRDGIVTALELYDAGGEDIALLFGLRKPGQEESPAWRRLLAGLPTLA